MRVKKCSKSFIACKSFFSLPFFTCFLPFKKKHADSNCDDNKVGERFQRMRKESVKDMKGGGRKYFFCKLLNL